jgi:hypothetical protein
MNGGKIYQKNRPVQGFSGTDQFKYGIGDTWMMIRLLYSCEAN